MKLEVDSHIGSGTVDVNGACVSTIVHVSFVAGGISMFPARSVAFDRNWYRPSAGGVNIADPDVVPTSHGIHPPALLYWMSYRAMSVVPTSGTQLTRNDGVVR